MPAVSDLVVFADIEALLAGWLRDRLTVPVGNKVPNPRPDSFVTVQRHGGIRATVVTDAPQVGVECWAVTDAQAHDLAQTARAELLYRLPGQILDSHTVYRVDEFAGPQNLPDPISAQPRWVFELQVHVRGLAA